MKLLRIVVVLLLAVLLPVRGVVAAAMLCPAGPAVETVSAQGHHGACGPQADHGHPAHHGSHAAAAGHAAGCEAAHDGAASDAHAGTCPSCASGCCMTPLAFAPPSVAGPSLTASVDFPALAAPVPAFHSEGQDRPPRAA